MMRLYFCHRKGEGRVLYIIAPSERRARPQYAHESECVVYPNSMTAQMYGIEYTDEERGRAAHPSRMSE